MARVVQVWPTDAVGKEAAANFLLDWNWRTNDAAIGGATGNSPVGVWQQVWKNLERHPEAWRKLVARSVGFLDEYLGAFPSYHHWVWRNLKIDRGGFPAKRVSLPRGCFFEDDRIVTSARLDQILEETQGQWTAGTVPGPDGELPEIRISASATHPVLCQIRDSVAAYDQRVRALPNRLQILGIGVEGHIGFVEQGAAARDTRTMLVRLAQSTRRANEDDFRFRDAEGNEVLLEPAHYAITQGIDTVLSAETILMLAWGGKKREAVARMLTDQPGPLNPAGWIQQHEQVTVILDQAALGDLTEQTLAARDFRLERHAAPPEDDEIIGY